MGLSVLPAGLKTLFVSMVTGFSWSNIPAREYYLVKGEYSLCLNGI